MLPAARTHRSSLADVLPNCLDALTGRRGRLGLPPVTHAVVVVADGLGHAALAAHRGHARVLGARLDADRPIDSGFPTTTAAALASLTTGTPSGRHGLVGYTVLHAASGAVVNELSGWIPDGGPLDPATWQRMPTLFERAAATGVAPVAIAPSRYAATGFTAAVLRGAAFSPADRWPDRIAAARRELAAPGPRLVYLYAPDLDVAGHAHGVDSGQWTAALEALDAGVAELSAALGPGQGLLVTADHGMVDVDRAAHRIVPPALLADVAHLAGEPRCLQVFLAPGADAAARAEDWRAWAGSRAWVATRAEAVAAGWFGEVDAEVLPRIGDLLVAARGATAFYADELSTARRMVGQHGSLSAAELAVPLLRFGAFAG